MDEYVTGLLEITFFNNRTEIITIVDYDLYSNGDIMFLYGSNRISYPWKNILFFERIRALTDKEKRIQDILRQRRINNR